MVLWIYRLVFLPALLVLAPYYLWRMRRRGGYRESFAQRFGALPEGMTWQGQNRKRIWLQAVSVGELLAVEPLLQALAAEPDWQVYLTTTTSTGFRLARERYGKLVMKVGYFPTDFWAFSARAWRGAKPDLAILTEGERWPEHIRQAAVRGVPVLNINARLSDRSFRRMKPVRFLVPGLWGGISRLLAVSPEEAARFHQLGFPPAMVTAVGNLKVDNEIEILAAADRSALRRELGMPDTDLVLLGSSTWAGEEAVMLRVWQQARAALPTKVRLLLVPRHAERRVQVEAVVQPSGARYHLRSRGSAPADTDILIADTTGELQRLTQVADLVFVGKSLAPYTEGQTPIEAAGLGRAVMFGPGMSNFRSIAHDLVENGVAQQVTDESELTRMAIRLLQDEAARHRAGEAGRQWHRRNRGALPRTMEVMRELLAD